MDLTADVFSAGSSSRRLRASTRDNATQAVAAFALLLLQRSLLLHSANTFQTLALLLLGVLLLQLAADALSSRSRARGGSVQRWLALFDSQQALTGAALGGAHLLVQCWLRAHALRHFGLLFAFLLDNAGLLLLQPLRDFHTKSTDKTFTGPLVLLGYLLVAGVDADEYGALLHTLALLALALALQIAADSSVLRETSSVAPGRGECSLLSLGGAVAFSTLLAALTPASFVRAQQIFNDRATADGGVMNASLWTLCLAGAANCQFMAARYRQVQASSSSPVEAKTQLVCSATGLLCALLAAAWQREWLRCILDAAACGVVLYAHVAQWRRVRIFSSKPDNEFYLDTYRSSALSPSSDAGVASGLSHVLTVLWAQRASRQLLLFLSANVAFMFVELGVGLYTNSLGLMGDAGHMLFDNGALVIGLVASYIGQLPPDASFTYGYGRVEVLSGFLNSLLLLVVSFHLLAEAATRFTDPPEVTTDHLLLTSTAGLVVNLVGLFWFHDHVHGHSHSHEGDVEGVEGCSGGHGHSHGHSHHQTHGEDAAEGGRGGGNSNMYGVYLHVLADTLGSVGVIISSVLIQMYEWHVADPVSSALISLLILGSTLPLLRDTARQLLQGAPKEMERDVNAALEDVQALVPGVKRVTRWHLWRHTGDVCVATLHLEVAPSADEQSVLQQTRVIFRRRAQLDEFLSVQISKPHVTASDRGGDEQGTTKNGCTVSHQHGHGHSHGHSHSHGGQSPLATHAGPPKQPQPLHSHAQQPPPVPSRMSTHENPAGDDGRRLAASVQPPQKLHNLHHHAAFVASPVAISSAPLQFGQRQRRQQMSVNGVSGSDGW
ncbi:hypothetical protein BBJ28_00009893 [Nothophytophthora sp. Chile5]|nr:hypothetical protein BBJ28_00009893 [Nothophytophthora sp. Chile5]